MLGGSSFIAHLMPAMLALQAGQCNNVLVCYGSTQRSGTMNRPQVAAARRQMDPQPYEMPYDPVLPVSAYALAAARHMHQFGTTREQLAEVAVAARAWAQKNPEAFMRDPLTVDDVLKARMVASPLTVRDCCLVTDGGGAFVLTRADAPRRPQKPVYVLGNATACWNRQISQHARPDGDRRQPSGASAFAMAGLRPRTWTWPSCTTPSPSTPCCSWKTWASAPRARAGAFVESGAIAPGGSLPVNTNGGGLSCTHPGMYGIFALIEAVRQLRGEAGERQVPGVHVALAHGNGGTLSSQATAILGTADTL
jgi:acetyl-CoA acetyltransferase